jgi:hypothetical protein
VKLTPKYLNEIIKEELGAFIDEQEKKADFPSYDAAEAAVEKGQFDVGDTFTFYKSYQDVVKKAIFAGKREIAISDMPEDVSVVFYMKGGDVTSMRKKDMVAATELDKKYRDPQGPVAQGLEPYTLSESNDINRRLKVMKLTSKELKKIIKEELQNVIDEQTYSRASTRLGDDAGTAGLSPEEYEEIRKKRGQAAADKAAREAEMTKFAGKGRSASAVQYDIKRKKELEKEKARSAEMAQNRTAVTRRLDRISGDDIIDAQIPRVMAKKRLLNHPFDRPVDLKDRLELLGFKSNIASRLQQKMRSAITSEIENKGFVPWAKQFDGEWDSKRQRFEFGAQSTDKYYDYIKNLAFSVGKAAGLNRPMLKRLGSFFSGKGFKE